MHKNDSGLAQSKKGESIPLPVKAVSVAVSCILGGTPFRVHSQERPDIPPAAAEEVLVTAQKRVENVQDVPVPVTVLSADALIDSNRLLIQDYYSSVPGLNISPNIESTNTLSIRGITTGAFTNPTVGILVDDVPYGASTGFEVPDIDPGDLARVEVLRGPQGTLYGANAMGGLIKYVTIDPSTTAVNGRLEAGTNSVYNGAEPGYSLRGSVNVPLGDTLAFRVSGFTRQDPGYIDNPILEVRGVNRAQAEGGRLSAMWHPTDVFSVKISALNQNTHGQGLSEVVQQPGLGDLQQNYIPGVGGYDKRVQAYSATVKAKLWGIDLTSLTGYNINEYHDSLDFSYIFGPSTQDQFGVTGSPIFDNVKTRKITQELRLSVVLGDRFDWLAGLFYTHENSQFFQHWPAENSVTGEIVGEWLYNNQPTTYEEYAAFTDLTYHITKRFDVQLGGRESQITSIADQLLEQGPYDEVFLGAASPFTEPKVRSHAGAFTYLVTPQFRLSPDLMAYARLASGYRPGGPNQSPGVPLTYKPDKTQNYELGVKGDFWDHALSVDASVYYIDWKDIQLQFLAPVTYQGYGGNGSAAKSQGVELSVEAHPLTGLTVSGWVSYDDAVLTKDFAANSSAYGVAGNRLPNSSRCSGNFSFQQEFPLANDISGFVGGMVSYTGERKGQFTSPPPTVPPRQELPGFAKTDLRAGVKYDSWTTNVYVNNVTDARGLLNGGLGYTLPVAFVYIQPRTVGLNVSKTF